MGPWHEKKNPAIVPNEIKPVHGPWNAGTGCNYHISIVKGSFQMLQIKIKKKKKKKTSVMILAMDEKKTQFAAELRPEKWT